MTLRFYLNTVTEIRMWVMDENGRIKFIKQEGNKITEIDCGETEPLNVSKAVQYLKDNII